MLRAILARSIAPAERARPATGLRDLDAIQRFASGSGPFAVLDAPWAPVFLCALFLFHWMLGLLAICFGRAAARHRAGQPGAHRTVAGGGRRGRIPREPFRRADAGGRRNRPRPRHAGRGARSRGRSARDGARPQHGGLGPQRCLRRHHPDAPSVPPVGDAGPRRLASDPRPGHVRLDHRGVDPARPGARSDRPGGGAMAGLAARARREARPGGAARGGAAGDAPDRAARAARHARRAIARRRRAGRPGAGGAQRELSPGARSGHGDLRPFGLRQVDARPRARRRLAPAGRHGAARRGGAGAVRPRSWQSCRLRAAGSGAVRGDGGAEHRPHVARSARRGTSSPRRSGPERIG